MYILFKMARNPLAKCNKKKKRKSLGKSVFQKYNFRRVIPLVM